jgi:hypothetical protein
VVTEEVDLEDLAIKHGYGIDHYETDDNINHQDNIILDTKLSYINPVPSQLLTLFQDSKIVHIDLDSGCWVSCVKSDFAKKMNWKILPNSQLAKLADDKTILKSVGEINETLTRNNWSVNLRALVLTQLHADVIGGNNFFKDNNIQQSIVSKTITVHNKYVVPETNRSVQLPTHTNNLLISALTPKVLMANQSIAVKVPFDDGNKIIVEPRVENSNKTWPVPQLCEVKNGHIDINNDSNKPIHFKNNEHHIQLVKTTEQETNCKSSPKYYKLGSVKKPDVFKVEDLSINYKVMNTNQKADLLDSMEKYRLIFDKDLSKGYNQFSGKHSCKLNWANQEKPISRKVSCPNYNSELNYLLQDVCDQLTDAGVLGIPQEDDITIQHVSPCFLRKKQKAKDKTPSQLTNIDVRLVVNTTELSKYLKNMPTKVTKPTEVYAALSKWKYIIKTDLYQGFFQNLLHPSAYPWCAIQTPYGGIRYFKRSIQGLVGQTEEQDELLAKILHTHLKEGKCVKIADDMFSGGNTIDEAIDNWKQIMKTLHDNNMKISPEKTIIFPEQVDILSWQWKQGGYLSPSPHRKLALENTKHEDLKTVKDIRSWMGLYKTFIDCTPNLTVYLDKFDQFVGSRDSKDPVIWTDDFVSAFKKAQEQITYMKDLYLPTKHDQLIIMCDGARTPPAVGMVLQARTPSGETKIVKYYSVKLKSHMVKWYPCELEAVALGASIEAFYEFIKQSTKPVIICPDSKPVVDAAKKIEKGHFSLSPRIQTFLNGLSKISYDIQHISGKSGHNAAGDFQSRNASVCNTENCQICKFIQETADTIIDVKLNAVMTENNDKSMVPFLNRQAWIKIQEKDPACKQAKSCLQSGQHPSKKPGKMYNNVRKYVAKATISKDGLLIVHGNIPMTTNKTERIVIPSEFVEAIVTQIHLKFQHPAKAQLVSVVNRYFFASGIQGAIDQLYLTCQLCQAAMKIPKALNTFTNTTTAEHPGTHFGLDIMRRAKQKIVVARDMFSSYVTAKFVDREDKDSLRDAIIDLVQPIRSNNQVTIRTDNAKGFQSLSTNDKVLQDLQLKIELSDPHNKNGNSCVDKAIAELITEITKLQPSETAIDNNILAQAVMNLNCRIRRRGNLSASEILFCRDQVNNDNLHMQDREISNDQKITRDNANERFNSKHTPSQYSAQKGDLVQMKANPKKHNLRDTFIVTNVHDNDCTVQKITNVFNKRKSQLMSKEYGFNSNNLRKFKGTIVSHKSGMVDKSSNYTRNCKTLQWNPIRRSASESSIDYIGEINSDEDNYEHDQDETLHHDLNGISPAETSPENNLPQQNLNVSLDSLSNNGYETVDDSAPLDGENDNLNVNDEYDTAVEADNDSDNQLIDRSKKRSSKKKKKEIWSTEKPLSYRPPRKARTQCLRKLYGKSDTEEVLRDDTFANTINDPLMSTVSNFTRLVLNTSDSEIEEPNADTDWDENDMSGTPSYFNNAFCESEIDFLDIAPTEMPNILEPGRVYNLSNLPPPGSITTNEPLRMTTHHHSVEYGRVYDLSMLPSPPSKDRNKESTLIKYSKSLGKSTLAKLRKKLSRQH